MVCTIIVLIFCYLQINFFFSNSITILDGSKINYSEDRVPIHKRTINKVTLEFSVEIEQPNIENILLT